MSMRCHKIWTSETHQNHLANSPHNGFLVTDPGGYILEFEYFAPHEENVKFIPTA